MIISSIYMISYQTITSNHNILFQQHISLSWDCGSHHPHPAFPSFPGFYLFLVGLLFGCICLFILLICLQINFFLLIVHLLAYQFFLLVCQLAVFFSFFIHLFAVVARPLPSSSFPCFPGVSRILVHQDISSLGHKVSFHKINIHQLSTFY